MSPRPSLCPSVRKLGWWGKKVFSLVLQDVVLIFVPKLCFPSRCLQPATSLSSFWASVNLYSFWHYGSSKMPLHLPALIIPFFSVCDWPHPAVLAMWLLRWKKQAELSPPWRLLLSKCSSWCISGFRSFGGIRKTSALVSSRILQTFLLLPWEKKEKLVKGIVRCHINWQCWQ